MQITSIGGRVCRVGKLLGQTGQQRIYECTISDDQPAILKIALEISDNICLDREAMIIRMMAEEAESWEADFAETAEAKEHPEIRLNYYFYFPNLIESFIAEDQGSRRVSLVGFPKIARQLVDLVPILHLTTRDRVRIDPMTSAWISGKLLKLLVFTHSLKIQIGNLTGENLLINRGGHFVAVFDWTEARLAEKGLSDESKAEEISQVTRAVVLALGGNPDTGELLKDPQLVDDQYQAFLQKLLSGGETSAKVAHGDFYKLIGELWPRKYHPFTAYALDEFEETSGSETEEE